MAKSSAGTDVKKIILLRHAKSAWGLDVSDHDRPLSGRGRRDGVAVGEYLNAHKIKPDIVICSTAVRARDTWLRAVKGGAHGGDVRYLEDVYEAWAPDLAKIIRGTNEEAGSVLMIGHAPGIPDLVEYLAVRRPKSKAWSRLEEKFPTSALAVLELPGSWADAGRNRAELTAFEVPRASQGKKK